MSCEEMRVGDRVRVIAHPTHPRYIGKVFVIDDIAPHSEMFGKVRYCVYLDGHGTILRCNVADVEVVR